MAQVDASIPLQAYTAADYQKQTMNQMAIEDMQTQREQSRQAMQDQKALRETMAGADTSTPEGQAAVLHKVGGIDPAYRLKLEKDFSDAAKSKAEVGKYNADAEHSKIESVLKKTEIIGREASSVKDAYQSARAAGKPESEAMKIGNDAHVKGLANLFQEGVIDTDQFKQMVTKPFDVNNIDIAISQTMSHKEKLQQELAESKAKETERHNKTEEGINSSRVSVEKQKLTFQKAQAGEDLTDDEIKLATGMVITDPRGLSSLPAKIRTQVLKKASAMGITAEDISSGRAAAKFDQAAATTAGHRSGALATVEAAMPGLIQNAKEASKQVDRGSFVPLNKLEQMADGSISDPKLRAFKLANQAVASEYQQVISRGGSNVTSLKEAMHQLQTADSEDAYNAALDMVEKEIKVNVAASKQVRKEIGGKEGKSDKADSKVVHWDDLK